jgi:cellobiose-specific phosphotransferase system component IIA
MRQESQRIIRWKQRETDQISKDDQHKEVIQMSFFLLHFQIHLMEHQSIEDLPDHFRRVFQFHRERGK